MKSSKLTFTSLIFFSSSFFFSSCTYSVPWIKVAAADFSDDSIKFVEIGPIYESSHHAEHKISSKIYARVGFCDKYQVEETVDFTFLDADYIASLRKDQKIVCFKRVREDENAEKECETCNVTFCSTTGDGYDGDCVEEDQEEGLDKGNKVEERRDKSCLVHCFLLRAHVENERDPRLKKIYVRFDPVDQLFSLERIEHAGGFSSDEEAYAEPHAEPGQASDSDGDPFLVGSIASEGPSLDRTSTSIMEGNEQQQQQQGDESFVSLGFRPPIFVKQSAKTFHGNSDNRVVTTVLNHFTMCFSLSHRSPKPSILRFHCEYWSAASASWQKVDRLIVGTFALFGREAKHKFEWTSDCHYWINGVEIVQIALNAIISVEGSEEIPKRRAHKNLGNPLKFKVLVENVLERDRTRDLEHDPGSSCSCKKLTWIELEFKNPDLELITRSEVATLAAANMSQPSADSLQLIGFLTCDDCEKLFRVYCGIFRDAAKKVVYIASDGMTNDLLVLDCKRRRSIEYKAARSAFSNGADMKHQAPLSHSGGQGDCSGGGGGENGIVGRPLITRNDLLYYFQVSAILKRVIGSDPPRYHMVELKVTIRTGTSSREANFSIVA